MALPVVGGGLAPLRTLWAVVLPAMPAATERRPTETRRTLLNFRVAAGEREQLQQLAQSQGLSLSELVRRSLEAQGFRPCK